jgi:multidrug resistance protein, MATE family
LFDAAATLVIGMLGSRALASHQIAFNAATMTFMVPMGLSFAVSIRVGYYRGRQDLDGLRAAGWVGLLLGLVVQITSGLVFFFAPQVIAGVYTDDPALIGVAAALLRVAGIFQIFDGLQVVAVGVLRGLKDTRVPFFNTLISYWLVGAPLGLILAFWRGMGTIGIWYGMVAALGSAALLHIIRFTRVCHRVCGRDMRATILHGSS